MADIKKIQKYLLKMQDEKRYMHTMAVTYTATALAMKYGADVKNAELAGLLHDCAKCMSNKQRLKICKKHNIHFTEFEQRNPFLLHAKVGSFVAMDTFGIKDSDVINAVLNHTFGRPGMSLLEKIIYVADYIEPQRKHDTNLPEVRKLAFEDLDRAFLQILEDKLAYLHTQDGEIEPMTQKTYEYYKELENKNGF